MTSVIWNDWGLKLVKQVENKKLYKAILTWTDEAFFLHLLANPTISQKNHLGDIFGAVAAVSIWMCVFVCVDYWGRKSAEML